ELGRFHLDQTLAPVLGEGEDVVPGPIPFGHCDMLDLRGETLLPCRDEALTLEIQHELLARPPERAVAGFQLQVIDWRPEALDRASRGRAIHAWTWARRRDESPQDVLPPDDLGNTLDLGLDQSA